MSAAAIIDGKEKARQLSLTIKDSTAQLKKDGIVPGLAVIIIGEDPASQVYVRNKKRTAEECGFYSVQHKLEESISEKEILDLIALLNQDDSIHGILVQLPLPKNLNEELITQSIDPKKDVDGFHYMNIGKLAAGDSENTFVPCTPAGCMLMIADHLGHDLSGMQATVIGRSNIVGKPMASLLLQANATITICHSRTKDLPSLLKNSDIVVAAVGMPEMIKGEWIKPGAVIIDVGINRVTTEEHGKTKSKLVGDVDFNEAVHFASAITPVPGGVGPMTIALLMYNTLNAAKKSVLR
jgi:methylenetetrahydrofolate dehydrogenase (NADP+)/methenyltetrahydrofolate cyclohydrolase